MNKFDTAYAESMAMAIMDQLPDISCSGEAYVDDYTIDFDYEVFYHQTTGGSYEGIDVEVCFVKDSEDVTITDIRDGEGNSQEDLIPLVQKHLQRITQS